MSERPPSNESQIAREIVEAYRERVVRLRESEQLLATERLEIDRLHEQQVESFSVGGRSELEQLESEYAIAKSQLQTEFESRRADIQQRLSSEMARIQKTYDLGVAESAKQFEEAEWMLDTVHDGSTDENPEARYDAFVVKTRATRDYLQSHWVKLEEVYKSMSSLLQARRQATPSAVERDMEPIDGPGECANRIEEGVGDAERCLSRLKSQWSSALFAGSRPVQLALVLFVISWGAMAAFRADLFQILDDPGRVDWGWVGLAAACAVGFTLVAELVILMVARWRAQQVAEQLLRTVQQARWTMTEWKRLTGVEQQELKSEAEKWKKHVEHQRSTILNRATALRDSRIAELNSERERLMADAQTEFPGQLIDLEQANEQRVAVLDTEYPRRIDACRQNVNSELDAIETTHQSQLGEWSTRRDTLLGQIENDWQAIAGNCDHKLKHRLSEIESLSSDWTSIADSEWPIPAELPTGISLGKFLLKPVEFLDDDQAKWVREDSSRLERNPESIELADELFTIPSTLPFPGNPSLIVKSDGAGRRQADTFLKLAMTRLLTSFPAGKLRFTVIDPISLGENFAGFMHLADYDEQLIGSRIWTETSQIEKRLTLLTEHMENVFQSYLRNEFSTIQEYNEHAGEVAEPYQVLVVAGFPTNFSEPAMRRIHSIATSGERCGVYLLMSVDERLKLPPGLDLEDIESNSTVVKFRKGRASWDEPFLRKLDFDADPIPDGDVLSTIVKKIGQESKLTRRVEVAFDRVAPRGDALWNSSSRHGIEVPLGRAGATKLQNLSLGNGTSQHVLVAGKTGSGKTTFLHTLITNVALHYSPSEVEFYLIDFKKGVEFKTYAASGFPHARVIAIESDREFGLSVLERLDALLKERGDLFREAGVPDLPTYREHHPDRQMPRVLLIVDEFQEFFVEDDRIAQNSALFLDRLVRQGRAFGIHVLLGSQTLSGAYSLARSTLGQVAVRIALQCSETDAHLILSEENTAARLLTRPGEAIYNDANGLVEGNHPFQIAFLPDSQRDQYLGRISQMLQVEQVDVAPTVVFEGHLPAELADNAKLAELIESPPEECPSRFRLWVGDAVSIKDPTSVELHEAAGRNALICGANAHAARGVIESFAVSLSAQLPRFVPDSESVPFVVLDGSEPGTPNLESLFESLPQPCLLCSPGEADAAIDEMYDDLQSRLQRDPGSELAAPRFLVISSLGRFRELRKSDDDFGYGGFDSKPELNTAQQFAELIKSGPSAGIHAIIWSDSYANLSRWMSVSVLRDFEIRIGFQMNSSDSSQLFDSPVAGQLGPHRGVVFFADEGRMERFRPYRPTSTEFRESLATRLIGDSAELDSLEDIDEWTVI